MTAEEYRQEGFRLFYGEDCEPDVDQATKMFYQAADGHDAIAAVALGSIALDNEEYQTAREWYEQAFSWYVDAGKPEEDASWLAFGHFMMGKLYYYNYEEMPEPFENFNKRIAFSHFKQAYEMGLYSSCELLGRCYYEGVHDISGTPNQEQALKIWEVGHEKGENSCTLCLCIHYVDADEADENTVKLLEQLVNDPDDPCADACAVLYQYYMEKGDEDTAFKWREQAIDMESDLMESILENEREQEIGEDDYTDSDDYEQEFEAYDDETEAAAPAAKPSSPGDLCVIVVDTDGCFRIEHADASDWDTLPSLIDADRTDNLRCNKFRQASADLKLRGTLLGLLDRDAFRKTDLEPNWHASQWYDGMADLYGDMIICMEDSSYNPISFANEAEAQRVIDKLKQ